MESENDDIILEKSIKGQSKSIKVSISKILIEYAEKRICKIKINEETTGTGFFCNIPLDGWESIKALLTNNHLLNQDDIIPGKKIKFSLNNGKECKEILIDEQRKTFTSEKYDITIIEIKKSDNIKIDSFFEIDNRIDDDISFFKGNSIYLLQYPKGEEMEYSEGEIKEIVNNNYILHHSCNSNKGSSGGPLIDYTTYHILGIHKGAPKDEKKNYNVGIFLNLPIKEFNEEINNKRIKNDDNGVNDSSISKSVEEECFIKEGENNIKILGEKIKEENGKHIYENGNICYNNKYVGDFINDKYQGKVEKYCYRNGEYYSGNFEKGLKDGKGKEYYNNGNPMYDGDFVKGKYQGKGIFHYENGDYYDGEWENGLKHGKGKEFYKNGKIKYDGDFVKGKFEGEGKFYWEDGEYYEGQFLNNLRDGEGKEFYKNNCPKYVSVKVIKSI